MFQLSIGRVSVPTTCSARSASCPWGICSGASCFQTLGRQRGCWPGHVSWSLARQRRWLYPAFVNWAAHRYWTTEGLRANWFRVSTDLQRLPATDAARAQSNLPEKLHALHSGRYATEVARAVESP